MINQIEAAIVARLNDVAKSNAFKVKAESYGGELDDTLLKDAAQSAPAFWIAFAGAKKGRKVAHDKHEWQANFVVISAAKSMHQEQVRQGGRGGLVLGAYEMIHFAISALEGFMPEGSSQALVPHQVTNLFNAKIEREYLAIYSVTFSCKFPLERVSDTALDDLESLFHSSKPHHATEETPIMESEIQQQEDD